MKSLRMLALLTICALPIGAQTVPSSVVNVPVTTIPILNTVSPPKPILSESSVIKAGTPLEVELAYTVSSKDLTEGDAISFRMLHPLKVGDTLVIEQGALATGRVTKAEGGKSWGRGGRLGWMIQNVIATDGTPVPLRFSTGTKGDGAPGTVVTGVVITTLLFWPAVPLWGFKHGKAAVIPAGKRFEVLVHRDTEILGTVTPVAAETEPSVLSTKSVVNEQSARSEAKPDPTAKTKKKKEWWEMN